MISTRWAYLAGGWAAFAAALAIAWAGATSSPRAAGRAPAAPEIRFGVVEPPVVAQRDITVRALASNREPEPLPLECSGLAWVDGRLLVLSDRHGRSLFTCEIDLDAMTIGLPVPHMVIGNEQELLDDPECLTVRLQAGRGMVAYVLCSLSNDNRGEPLPKRRHMLEIAMEGGEPARFGEPLVLNVSLLRTILTGHFEAVGVEPYRTYYGESPGPDKNTYRWANVEGIAFTPDGSGLLCGMRNPLFGGRALLFVVAGLDEAVRARQAAPLKVTDLFTLDLGERGVSDLYWDERTKGYLICAAKSNGPKLDKDQPFPPNTLDSALFWWSGRKGEQPVLFARVPAMKIEAICRLGFSRYIAIGSDEGDVSEGREQRQSVLTIMEFTGLRSGR